MRVDDWFWFDRSEAPNIRTRSAHLLQRRNTFYEEQLVLERFPCGMLNKICPVFYGSQANSISCQNSITIPLFNNYHKLRSTRCCCSLESWQLFSSAKTSSYVSWLDAMFVAEPWPAWFFSPFVFPESLTILSQVTKQESWRLIVRWLHKKYLHKFWRRADHLPPSAVCFAALVAVDRLCWNDAAAFVGMTLQNDSANTVVIDNGPLTAPDHFCFMITALFSE